MVEIVYQSAKLVFFSSFLLRETSSLKRTHLSIRNYNKEVFL